MLTWLTDPQLTSVFICYRYLSVEWIPYLLCIASLDEVCYLRDCAGEGESIISSCSKSSWNVSKVPLFHTNVFLLSWKLIDRRRNICNRLFYNFISTVFGAWNNFHRENRQSDTRIKSSMNNPILLSRSLFMLFSNIFDIMIDILGNNRFTTPVDWSNTRTDIYVFRAAWKPCDEIEWKYQFHRNPLASIIRPGNEPFRPIFLSAFLIR